MNVKKNLITSKVIKLQIQQIIKLYYLKGIKKLFPTGTTPEITTRLKHMITSVNGDRERKNVRDFVDNEILARDSRALRQEIKRISPDINLTIKGDDGEDIAIPISLNFFWPDFNSQNKFILRNT